MERTRRRRPLQFTQSQVRLSQLGDDDLRVLGALLRPNAIDCPNVYCLGGY